jgi:hypothetical protein
MAAITPELFHIDYGRLLETLVCIIVFSFFVERVLAVLFESRPFIDWSEGQPEVREKRKNGEGVEEEVVISPEKPKKKGIREFISVTVSIIFCLLVKFDAITIILQSDTKMTFWGMVFTGFIISGGSKASIALFQNLMGVMSSAEQMRKENSKKQNS